MSLAENEMKSKKQIFIAGPLYIKNNRKIPLYEKIGNLCDSFGLKPFIPHLHTEPIDEPADSHVVFHQDYIGLESSELIIAEISSASHGVGSELMQAYLSKIPIVCIIEKGKNASRMVRGNPALIRTIEYEDEDLCIKYLRTFLKTWIAEDSRKILTDSYITPNDAKKDINTIIWSMKLYNIRRFYKHRFWEKESIEAEFASRIEKTPRLESVAEHSWHVTDTVILLGDHFSYLNLERCIKMAILHDKMEIYIGDKNPVGKSGTGKSTHAFNEEKRLQKDDLEIDAIEKYLEKLRPSIRKSQRNILNELVEGSTVEAKFVKAVDKLQAFAYVLIKKRGNFSDQHLRFTLKYSMKAIEYFPGLEAHYNEIKIRLFRQVAKNRKTNISDIKNIFEDKQLYLF